jgi:accessory gene regulator protein AgrB
MQVVRSGIYLLDKLAIKIANIMYNSLSVEQKNDFEARKKGYKNLLLRIKFLIITILLIFCLVPIGYAFDIKQDLIIGCSIFFLMRYWNDGHHFKTTDLCFIITLSAIMLVQLTNHYLSEYTLIITCFSFISILLFAPFRKQKTTNQYYRKKIIALIICIIGYFLGSIAVAAILIQSIDLIHKFNNERK